MKPIYPKSLTVLIRDETTLNINEPCTYRRVTVKLTPEQADSLQLRYTGKHGGFDTHEAVSYTLLEF